VEFIRLSKIGDNANERIGKNGLLFCVRVSLRPRIPKKKLSTAKFKFSWLEMIAKVASLIEHSDFLNSF
jgi:hypothetical protein